MLRNLLRLKQPFYIARQEKARYFESGKPFWNICYSKEPVLLRHAVCHGNC